MRARLFDGKLYHSPFVVPDQGTPGIGKTMFGVYCIFLAVKAGRNVLYKFRGEGYFVFVKNTTQVLEGVEFEITQQAGLLKPTDGPSADLIAVLKNDPDTMFVIDLHKERHLESLQNAFTIVCSFADSSKYSALITSGTQTLSILWMPTWPKKEVKKIFPNIPNVDARYNRHGGALRYLLWPEANAINDLNRVLDSSSQGAFISALQPECKDPTMSGRLVHYTEVDENFNNAVAKFASESIRNRVFTRFVLKERISLKVAADAMKFDTGFSSPRGVLSELAWHHELRRGGAWTLKDLERGESRTVNVAAFTGEIITCKNDMRDLDLTRVNAEHLTRVNAGDYVAPLKENFALIDSFTIAEQIWSEIRKGDDTVERAGDVAAERTLSLFGFQMASSQCGDHPLKGKHAVTWIAAVKASHTIASVCIVFVADETDLVKWTKQSFKTDKGKNYTSIPKQLNDVKQFVLGIPNLQTRVAHREDNEA